MTMAEADYTDVGALVTEHTLHDRLASLEQTAQSLNNKSNTVNDLLLNVKEKLVAYNIGLEVWLKPALSSTEEGDGWLEQQLGFTKVDGDWDLAVRGVKIRSGYNSTPEPVVVEPPSSLSYASRRERITAVRLLPALLEAIEGEAAQAIKAIEDATPLGV
jgi:hypothetical protein